KAMACSTPSSRPHLDLNSWATLDTSSGLFASSSRTSGGEGNRRAVIVVSLAALPNDVSTTSAPSSWHTRATAKAMLSGVRTPVIRSFLPARWLTRAPRPRSRELDLHALVGQRDPARLGAPQLLRPQQHRLE